MVDLFDIVGIVHFGIAGNANNSMSIGDVTIPQQFVHTGIWDWLVKPKGYNVPEGGDNLLGHIGFSYEFFSESGRANTARPIFWANTTRQWLHVASNLKGINLNQCVNSSVCLPQKPKLVVGLRGSASNIFVDNAAYRDFLLQTFRVSSVDLESSAVVMVSLVGCFPLRYKKKYNIEDMKPDCAERTQEIA
ncbi:bark storage protein A-like [Pyrus communis]|uniref:bark storage protein A-like n=1 Tax=Pyrus communis TaxID=23211 RepID=UPI0035BF41E6